MALSNSFGFGGVNAALLFERALGRKMADPIVLASDHRGFALKEALRRRLEAAGHEVRDVGAFSDESVNYPEFAAPAAGRCRAARCRAAS